MSGEPFKFRLFKEMHANPGAESCDLMIMAISMFRFEVNVRAEVEMVKTGNITGAHHRAIEAVWKELQ